MSFFYLIPALGALASGALGFMAWDMLRGKWPSRDEIETAALAKAAAEKSQAAPVAPATVPKPVTPAGQAVAADVALSPVNGATVTSTAPIPPK